MDNGVNVTDVGTLAGLRAVGGYGYGGHGNFVGDGSAVNANAIANRDFIETGNNATARGQQFLSNQIDRSSDFATNLVVAQNQSDRFNSIERLLFANQAATDRELKSIELKQVECCCELRAGQAAILAEIKCNRDVSEARQAGLNEAKIDAILLAQK